MKAVSSRCHADIRGRLLTIALLSTPAVALRADSCGCCSPSPPTFMHTILKSRQKSRRQRHDEPLCSSFAKTRRKCESRTFISAAVCYRDGF